MQFRPKRYTLLSMTNSKRARKVLYAVRLLPSSLEVIGRYAKAKGVTEAAVAREAVEAGLVVVAGSYALETSDLASGPRPGDGHGQLAQNRIPNAPD